MKSSYRHGLCLGLLAVFGAAHAESTVFQPHADSTGGQSRSHGSLLAHPAWRSDATPRVASEQFQPYDESMGGSSSIATIEDPNRGMVNAGDVEGRARQFADSTGGTSQAKGDLLDEAAAGTAPLAVVDRDVRPGSKAPAVRTQWLRTGSTDVVRQG